ncbi:Retrovirus-related Pol polyprotein from transposon 297 [Araneus ventricosus]|uniref:RNA-directed DNA polymerase n=1 Tax=Araneus ventricosus TaxID=182803 RepID=A0A4Y2JKB0_ARAVE|nr:Retrovirus-related Pol polyprotein from transposon 297 [Araneus ventricosus]
MFTETGPTLKTACGKPVAASGRCVLKVNLNGTVKPFEFLVFPQCSHQMILGWDFFRATDAVIDCGKEELKLAEILPDNITSGKSDFSLFAKADYLIEANSAKQICTLNPDIEDVDEALIIGEDREDSKEHKTRSRITREKLKGVLGAELTSFEKEELLHLLEEFGDIFDINKKSRKSRCNAVKHRIETSDNAPIKQRPYRTSATERRAIENEVQRMLKEDVIQPSDRPWSSPVVLVKKKNGEWRFCVNYRRLNKITKKDVYPLPRIDDALDCLAGAKIFSMMDLKSGYWQIEVDDKDREKTAFVTSDGLYEFKVMPFGLCNAPATFERMMDTVLRGLKWNICLCYLDDIIVYAPNFQEHKLCLRKVLKCIQEPGLTLNSNKCSFVKKKLTILGHLVDEHGIYPDPQKTAAVTKFPVPENVSDKKNAKFSWGTPQKESFLTLKKLLTSGPVLGHFLPNAEAKIHSDASGYGAVLVQVQNGKERPLAYASRSLTAAEKNYSTTEKECLAVVWAISKFRPYLFGRPFTTVVTDHHSLCWLANLKDPSGRLARWALRLQEYDINIVYKSCRKHSDADSLSRKPLFESVVENCDEIPSLAAITDYRKEQLKDKHLKSIIRTLEKGDGYQSYQMRNNVLYKRNYDPMRQ